MLFSITSSSKRWIAVAVGAPYDLILLRRITKLVSSRTVLGLLYDLQAIPVARHVQRDEAKAELSLNFTIVARSHVEYNCTMSQADYWSHLLSHQS
jgi:hypothetical protein